MTLAPGTQDLRLLVRLSAHGLHFVQVVQRTSQDLAEGTPFGPDDRRNHSSAPTVASRVVVNQVKPPRQTYSCFVAPEGTVDGDRSCTALDILIGCPTASACLRRRVALCGPEATRTYRLLVRLSAHGLLFVQVVRENEPRLGGRYSFRTR